MVDGVSTSVLETRLPFVTGLRAVSTPVSMDDTAVFASPVVGIIGTTSVPPVTVVMVWVIGVTTEVGIALLVSPPDEPELGIIGGREMGGKETMGVSIAGRLRACVTCRCKIPAPTNARLTNKNVNFFGSGAIHVKDEN